jgi:hypothetical protein
MIDNSLPKDNCFWSNSNWPESEYVKQQEGEAVEEEQLGKAEENSNGELHTF